MEYLAIDIQIILFYFYKNRYGFINQNLTTKIENINNLDKIFQIFIKKFLERRMEQHNLQRNYLEN